MTIKSSFGAVHLDVNPGSQPSAVLDPDTPFRVLLLGDFSGRSAQAGKPPAAWKAIEIDRDNFDEVLARVRPEFSGLRFGELDDFHPDRIYQDQRIPKSARGTQAVGDACDLRRSRRRNSRLAPGRRQRRPRRRPRRRQRPSRSGPN